jgi:two-component system, OmpR family, response regulator
MLPKTLALIDDDTQYTEFLSHHLQERGTLVRVFGDSNLLLADTNPYGYGFYIVDLMLPGIDGLDLIKVLRLRTPAGVLVVSGRLAPDVFEQAIGAGADMYLAKPVNFEQVVMAIEAVSRRVEMASPTHTPWKLDRRGRQLIAPDGARIDLSDGHLAVLECFAEADGKPVTRDALRTNLGRVGEADAGDNLNSTIFRLRRRIEKVTSAAMPLQAKSGVGYVFRSPLKSV